MSTSIAHPFFFFIIITGIQINIRANVNIFFDAWEKSNWRKTRFSDFLKFNSPFVSLEQTRI